MCRDPDSKRIYHKEIKKNGLKNRLKEMSAKRNAGISFCSCIFVCHFVQYSGTQARMSETFLIIDMMLGPQGLSSTYEQAHVDLDLLTLAS